MNSNVLNVVVPYKGCDKNCPYCISKITGLCQSPNTGIGFMSRNVTKVVNVINHLGINSIIITGKGEPLLNLDDTCVLINWFRDYPCELQTNGLQLKMNPELVRLISSGLNILSISVDTITEIEEFDEVIKAALFNNLVVRICLNISSIFEEDINKRFPPAEIKNLNHLYYLYNLLKDFKVQQLLIRNISRIENYNQDEKAVSTSEWIDLNCRRDLYYKTRDYFTTDFISKFEDLLPSIYKKHGIKNIARKIRKSSGNWVYDYNGLSVVCSDYCIEEKNGENIRSLIFNEDGHVYTLWNSSASILF